MELFMILREEWPKLKRVKGAFIVSALMIAAGSLTLSYWLVDRLYSARIDAKDATIQTLQTALDSVSTNQDVVNKLMDEAKYLRDQLAAARAREWPPLTDSQQAIWAKAVGETGVRVITVYWGQEVDALRFYKSLKDALRGTNIVVRGGGGNTESPQVVIYCHTDAKIGPVLKGLFDNLLRETSYPIRLEPGPNMKPEVVELLLGER